MRYLITGLRSPAIITAILESKKKIDEENRNLIDGLSNGPSNPVNADLNALRLNVDVIMNSLIEQARATSAAAQLQQQEALMNASLRNQMQPKEQNQLLALQKIEELKRKQEEQKKALEEAKKQQEALALQKYLARLTELERQAFLQRQQQIPTQNRNNDDETYTPDVPQGGDGGSVAPSPAPNPQPEPEPNPEPKPECPDLARDVECGESPGENIDCPDLSENEECDGNPEENPDCPNAEPYSNCGENPDCSVIDGNMECEGNENEFPNCVDGEENTDCGDIPVGYDTTRVIKETAFLKYNLNFIYQVQKRF